MSTLLLMPMLRNYVIVAFSVGAALGAGLVHGLKSTAFNYERTHETYVTRAEYERVGLHMSLMQVESILGRGTEIGQSESVIVFEWENSDDSSITIFFEDERLVQKEQVDLK